MRILLINDDPADGLAGAVVATRKLTRALRSLGHHCDVLMSGELGAWPEGRLRAALGPWLAWRAAARAWREAGPYDVIDAASAEGWIIAWARRWGQFPGAAIVTRSHGIEHIAFREMLVEHGAGLIHKPLLKRFWYPLARLSQVTFGLRLADRAILLNRQALLLVTNRGWKPAERIDVIPHGVDAARWHSAPASGAARGGGALFVGVLGERVGLPRRGPPPFGGRRHSRPAHRCGRRPWPSRRRK